MFASTLRVTMLPIPSLDVNKANIRKMCNKNRIHAHSLTSSDTSLYQLHQSAPLLQFRQPFQLRSFLLLLVLLLSNQLFRADACTVVYRRACADHYDSISSFLVQKITHGVKAFKTKTVGHFFNTALFVYQIFTS